MWPEDHKWHYDYVRLAWDAGFSFGKFKNINFDRNKIYLVDVDRVIKERDVSLVERHIPTVLQYVLEGDQSEILDRNFVNLFRMSQLSVEYLLFCKKYLDHTVTILKKDLPKLKQEIKQLRSYTEELEMHVALLTKNNLVTTFRCEKCSKAFSTEEYLNSHLKRRHKEENKLNSNIEAEKLHMEIKELKERLNNTEKCLRKDLDEDESDKLRDDELGASKLINEIQENFEKFREQVENKIETLHSDKKIYDDKYDKLFNVVLEYRNKEENQHNKQEVENVSKESPVKHAVIKESTTQTENFEKSQKLQIETIQCNNIYEYEDGSKEDLHIEDDHLHQKLLEKKMDTFGETIEKKISVGLFSIENQMKAFRDKLTELERNQHVDIITKPEHPEHSTPLPLFSATSIHTEDEKPKIKPRTKFSKPTSLPKTQESAREVEKIRSELGAILSKPKKDLLPKMVKSAVSLHKESSSSETESEPESIENEPSEVISDFKGNALVSDGMHVNKFEKTKNSDVEKPKSSIRSVVNVRKTNSPRKSSVTVRKAKPVESKRSEEKIKKEMSEKLYSRLQEMGISPNWKGIPKKTFERALEIVEHQANIDKKFLPNYDSVKKSIEKSLGLDKALEKKAGDILLLDDSPRAKKEKPNVIKIRYKRKTEENEPRSQPVVTIKNRSMYDTDSESEAAVDHIFSPTNKIEKNQAAVIEELKILQSKLIPSRIADTDSDLNSIMLSDDKNTPETKSAMKSYPSDGSLVKKKVLFDIEGVGTEENVLRSDGSEEDLTRQMNSKETKSNEESSFSDFEDN